MNVDQELQALERQLESDPNNEELRQRLIFKYSRAGQRDKARSVMRGRFRCPMEWTELTATEETQRRFCSECERNVHFTWTLEGIHQLVKDDACIAAPKSLVDKYSDELVRRNLESNKAPKTISCALDSDLPTIEELPEDFDSELYKFIEHLPFTDSVIPISRLSNTSNNPSAPSLAIQWHNTHAVVASTAPLTKNQIEMLKTALEADTVDIVLATPELINQAISSYLASLEEMFMGDIYYPEEDGDPLLFPPSGESQ